MATMDECKALIYSFGTISDNLEDKFLLFVFAAFSITLMYCLDAGKDSKPHVLLRLKHRSLNLFGKFHNLV